MWGLFLGLAMRLGGWLLRPPLAHPEVAFLFSKPKWELAALRRAEFAVAFPPDGAVGASPYHGSGLALPPLLFAALPSSELALLACGCVTDFVCSLFLTSIVRRLQASKFSYIRSTITRQPPFTVGFGWYWCNPFIAAATVCLDQHFHHALALGVVAAAVSGRRRVIGLLCGLLGYLEGLSAVVWLAPAAMLLTVESEYPDPDSPPPLSTYKRLLTTSLVFLLQATCVCGVCHALSIFWLQNACGWRGDLQDAFLHYARPCYASLVHGGTFRPTLSAIQHVLQLLFRRYQALYFVLLSIYPLLSLVPAVAAHANSPAFIIPASFAACFMSSPDACIADVALVYLAVALFESIANEAHVGLMYLVSCIGVVFFEATVFLWLRRDTGNSNFVFFQFLTIVAPLYIACVVFEWKTQELLYYSNRLKQE